MYAFAVQERNVSCANKSNFYHDDIYFLFPGGLQGQAMFFSFGLLTFVELDILKVGD
jgi:hypothetical protein